MKFRILLGIVLLTLPLPPLAACPFCDSVSTPTILEDFREADLIVLGRLEKAQLKDFAGTTDLVIEAVLKDHAFLKDKKTITLPMYIQRTEFKFLVFCHVYKGNLDPYRGISVKSDADVLSYLRGALKVKDRSPGDRLRHAFDYLESKESEVSLDAYREFAKADYSDYRGMAKDLDADLILSWLKDEKTLSFRYGLYSSLLGHSGNAKHAEFLRSMIVDPERNKNSGIAGMFSGYAMLEPAKGFELLEQKMLDPKQDFTLRYNALQSLRFFHKERNDVISKAQAESAVAKLMGVPDMSDFAVDDLRKWNVWDRTPEVLDYYGRKSHSISVVKRAIVRFALQSPRPEAATFIQEQRQRDPQGVEDTEEILRLEIGSENLPNGSKNKK